MYSADGTYCTKCAWTRVYCTASFLLLAPLSHQLLQSLSEHLQLMITLDNIFCFCSVAYFPSSLANRPVIIKSILRPAALSTLSCAVTPFPSSHKLLFQIYLNFCISLCIFSPQHTLTDYTYQSCQHFPSRVFFRVLASNLPIRKALMQSCSWQHCCVKAIFCLWFLRSLMAFSLKP